MKRKWCLTDLITDPVSGRLSETKVSVLVGKALCMWGFVYLVLKGTSSEWLFLIMLITFMAHESWSRIAVARYLNVEPKKEET